MNSGDLAEKLREEAIACIRCGFCEPKCSVYKLMGYKMIYGPRGRTLLSRGVIEGEISLTKTIYESMYTCLLCETCLVACPAGLNPSEITREMRKMIVRERPDFLSECLKACLAAFKKSGNPLGLQLNELTKWINRVREKLSARGETTLYTGLLYQLMPYSEVALRRLRGKWIKRFLALINVPGGLRIAATLLKSSVSPEKVSRFEGILEKITHLLNISGIQFTYLTDEVYNGILIHDLGFEKEFEEHVGRVSKTLIGKGVDRVVTVDPHTAEAFEKIYPRYVKDFKVKSTYYLDILANKMRELNPKFESKVKVVIHDPCKVARSLGKSEIVRVVLNSIENLEIREPVRSKLLTGCCGGPIEAVDPDLAEEIARERVRELLEESTLVVTACPVCLSRMDDLVSEGGGRVFDIAELLYYAVTSHRMPI